MVVVGPIPVMELDGDRTFRSTSKCGKPPANETNPDPILQLLE